MKLLSIDVGMKNLAFCLININENKSYCIEKWDVLNICDNSKKICCISGCHSEAKFSTGDKYYCKSHAKHIPLGLPTAELNPLKIKKS